MAYLPEGREEKADFYCPLNPIKDTKLPTVVWIHGGGWNWCDTDKTMLIELVKMH